jgi:hypothetical protein
MHLGKWIRLGPRASHPPPQVWSKAQTFPYGSYVKYSGDVYKSVGYCNAALPSDSGHYRFYVSYQSFRSQKFNFKHFLFSNSFYLKIHQFCTWVSQHFKFLSLFRN